MQEEKQTIDSRQYLGENRRRVSVIRWAGKSFEGNTDKRVIQRSSENFTRNNAHEIKESDSTQLTPSSSSTSTNTKYRCFFCKKSFRWYSHWTSHERTHTGERPFQCEICLKSFARSDNLQSHKLTHMAKLSLSTTKDMIWNNKDSCIKEVLFQFETAYKQSFASSTTVRQRRKLFSSHQCQRNFFSSAGFVRQLHDHKDTTEIQCKVCQKQFTKRSALHIHMRVHTGEKPYQCNVCPKGFSIHGNLKRHMLIHTGERPYRCSQCSTRFNNPSHLTRHVKRKHAEHGVAAQKQTD